MTRRITLFTGLVLLGAAAAAYPTWLANRDGPSEPPDLKSMGDFALVDSPAATDDVIPKRFRGLDGKSISLEGFIHSDTYDLDQISSFRLDNPDFANSSGWDRPSVQECVYAIVAGGRRMPNPGMYTLVKIHGVLHVGIQRDESGKIASIYRMDVDGVNEVK